MWPEIKTRKCFSRLASELDAVRRPAVALARRLPTRLPAREESVSPFNARAGEVREQASLERLKKSRQDGGATEEKCPRRGTSLVVATRASRPDGYAETRRGCLRITRHSSPFIVFLIGTPRLEFRATATKQSPDQFSNRDTLGCLLPSCRTELSPRPATYGRAFRTAGIPAVAFAFSCLILHQPAEPDAPCGRPLLTSHKSPVTRHAFLIYGAAIRNPAKVLKT